MQALLYSDMSILVVDMDEVRSLAQRHSIEMGLERLRVVGQYVGSWWDAGRLRLEFGNVSGLASAGGRAVLDASESALERVRRARAGLVEGAVCDVRCCVMGRDVEVMELRVLTLREVQALGEFLAGDAGREFMSLSSGALQHAGHDRRDDEDGR